jgi:hypothetical protein
MAKVVWTQESVRYEAGVSHGILYPSSGPGVAWNGLLEVEESYSGGDVTPYHFDGIKYLNLASTRNYQASISAISAPEEFLPCIGEKSVVPGFILTRQAKSNFGFSYRTNLDTDLGYKIHLVYNAVAAVNQRGHYSINQTLVPNTHRWSISATPPKTSNLFKPSTHYIIDSTKVDPDVLYVLETILYGDVDLEPRLLSPEELVDIVVNWSPVIITEQLVTGLATLTAGNGDLYETRNAGLFQTLPHGRLANTLVGGLYTLEV